jgi:hypothetical protein
MTAAARHVFLLRHAGDGPLDRESGVLETNWSFLGSE